MSAEGFLFGCIIISLLIGIYNMWMMGKIMKGVTWILSHVHVVGKRDEKDPNLTAIKNFFGIPDLDPDLEDVKDAMDEIDDIDLDGKE